MAKVKSQKLYQAIQPSYRNLIIIFSVLALVLVLLVLYFALSQATITVTPAYANQRIGFIVQVLDKSKVGDGPLGTQKIPGLLKDVTVSASREFDSSQNENTSGKASGKITIINNYTQNQPLVATTRFQSPEGLIFRLPQTIVVPAKSKMEVTVVADQPGAQYEIGPSKFSIPGFTWRQQYIWAESTGQMVRGKTTDYLLTQADIDKATAQMNVDLLVQAKDKLKSQLAASESLFDKSMDVKTVKSSVSEKVGSKKPKFTVDLTLDVKGLVLNEDELKQQAMADLPDAYKQKDSLVKVDPASFTYDVMTLDANSENILAQIKGEYILQAANVNIDKSKLKGMSKQQAESYLTSQSDVLKADITLPFWTKYLPPLEDNISVNIIK